MEWEQGALRHGKARRRQEWLRGTLDARVDPEPKPDTTMMRVAVRSPGVWDVRFVQHNATRPCSNRVFVNEQNVDPDACCLVKGDTLHVTCHPSLTVGGDPWGWECTVAPDHVLINGDRNEGMIDDTSGERCFRLIRHDT